MKSPKLLVGEATLELRLDKDTVSNLVFKTGNEGPQL